MNNKEAIQAIKSNYPDERYTMLREALDLAIKALEEQDNAKRLKEQGKARRERFLSRFNKKVNRKR